MESQKKCERCGKKLSTGIGPDGPVKMGMTGETICGDCSVKMMKAMSPPVNDNYEVNEFRKKAIIELTQNLGIQESSLSLYFEQFMSYDVEINLIDNIYKIEIIYDLLEDLNRWKKVRDFIISYIKDNPLRKRSWHSQRSDNPNLVTSGQFVFIFISEEYQEPPNYIGEVIAKINCQSIDLEKLGWSICPISKASEESQNRDITDIISEWAITQKQPETLRANIKKAKYIFSTTEYDCDIYIIHR